MRICIIFLIFGIYFIQRCNNSNTMRYNIFEEFSSLLEQPVSSRNFNLHNNILENFPLSILPISSSLSLFQVMGFQRFLEQNQEYLKDELTDMTPENNQQFDFIVIGAGSAGATIAARLSEMSNITVLLIEAGGKENMVMNIPLLVNCLQFFPIVNWDAKTEPATNYCQGMEEKRCNWPRGKVMGGSSVLNYMIATRGRPEDYNAWERQGNQGWGYKNVLPYFKKIESMDIDVLEYDSKYHNRNGSVTISYPGYRTPLAEAFIDAGLEMGYKYIDFNANKAVGVSYVQTTMINGERQSTNRAYLHPASDRSNLFISMNSEVTRILINKKKNVFGVEFMKNGKNITVKNRKEVILSAGTIGSPKILMLSGIGPENHLKEMGINVVKNLSVGENLQDHFTYGGLFFLIDKPVSIVTKNIINIHNPFITNYLMSRAGPISIPGGLEALLFLNINDPQNLTAYPNVELLFAGASIVSDPLIHKNFGITDFHWRKYFRKFRDKYSWQLFPTVLHPKSRGKVLLRSKKYEDNPRIIPNYISHNDDLQTMVKAIRTAIKISKTNAMQRFNSELIENTVPGCEIHKYNSINYWECAIRTYTLTLYNFVGTCKMGPKKDPNSVVDSKLKVRGIGNLRVADASIMPTIITGHVNVPTIMIGEKCADMIKSHWVNLKKSGGGGKVQPGAEKLHEPNLNNSTKV